MIIKENDFNTMALGGLPSERPAAGWAVLGF